MFNLIITIIAIALVVVLTATSVYYGGSAFAEGTADAISATFINQAQQVQAAATLYSAQEGGRPTSVLTDLTGKYLSSQPRVSGDSTQQWTIGSDTTSGNSYVYVSQPVSATSDGGLTLEVCGKINDAGADLVRCSDGGASVPADEAAAAALAAANTAPTDASTQLIVSMAF